MLMGAEPQVRNTRTVFNEVASGRRNDPPHVLEADPGYKAISEAMERSERLGEPVVLRVRISPVTARWLLAGNVDNRNFSETTSTKYSKDMTAGRWPENGDGFSIAKGGELNNGQHRLIAVIHSGVTITSNVTVGLERESRATNDIGLGRTLASILSMTGKENSSSAVAMTRLIIGWEESRTNAIRPARETTNLQVMDRIENDIAIMESVSFISSWKKRAQNLMSPSQLGFVHYMLTAANKDQADAFMLAVVTGADGDRGLNTNDPRYLARERLAKDYRILKAQERIEILFRAWNLWREGKTISKFMITGRTPDPIA